MAADLMHSTRGRTWSDFLAILTSVSILALAIWPGDRTASETASRELGSAQTVWLLHGLGGLLGLGGVLLAQRWRLRMLGRALVAIPGVALLAAMFLVGDLSTRSVLTLGLPGALLLLSAVALGPMPAPEER